MKLAIVGASKLTDQEYLDAIELLGIVINEKKPSLIISGGAMGIDSIAEELAASFKIPFHGLYTPINTWAGFKKRNELIAQACDFLVCVATTSKKQYCYHHNTDTHDRTGGCYTLQMAIELKKGTELKTLISRDLMV